MSVSRILLAAASAFIVAASAQAYPGKPVPQDDRVFPRSEEAFGPPLPIPGLQIPDTERVQSIDSNGAIYRYEVPANWNGDLVMYAHGFRGCVDPVTGELEPLEVENPPLREYYLSKGYAWAASSYSKNCYDVKDGVESTNRLWRIFAQEQGKPEKTLITGFSMGGHVTGAAIEMFPNVECPKGRRGRICERFAHILGKLSGGVEYHGAAPACGVMGDEALFQYFGDFGYAAEALAAEVNPLIQSQFPPPDNYRQTTLPLVIGTLFSNQGSDYPFGLTPQGEKLKDLTRVISGGERPIVDDAFPFFQNTLFGLAGSDGTVDGVVSGNIYDNIGKVYQLDDKRRLSADERVLNDTILRVERDPNVNPRRFLRLERVPVITGRISIPVISTHTLGDLFVPFSMQQIYAREVKQQRRSEYLVSRATRAIGHCEFSSEELIRTFDDLVTWVESGKKPKGDNILNPNKVAKPSFGCRFTEGSTDDTPETLRFGAC
ncbi:alpha/beta hydrolase [Lentisalinibacter sediminis]|uniref:alpha/beta hydrolase n=1 Tax=Lentisalinibacter sediminis TaxID=2992237 RepID=UPI00386362F0